MNISEILRSQYEAAFETLAKCIEHSPDSIWSGLVGNHRFDQSAFHALFFADLYLGEGIDEVKVQEFHQQHSEFEGYEELESKKPTNEYSKTFVNQYLDFCREKMNSAMRDSNEGVFARKASFPWLEMSRGELHVYNIRHLQHHAAQLVLRSRLDSDVDINWERAG